MNTEDAHGRNVSYIFIPFSFEDSSTFGKLRESLSENSKWSVSEDKITYMLKYVADKMDNTDPKNCRCLHYNLTAAAGREWSIGTKDEWNTVKAHEYMDDQVNFRFEIAKVSTYVFSTKVGILSYEIHFEKAAPLWISTALYYLKKASRERIAPHGVQPVTLVSLAKEIMLTTAEEGTFNFFFYAKDNTERANILTYVETEDQKNTEKYLFYLRRCYSASVSYGEDNKLRDKDMYSPSDGVVWGISTEAGVCLTCPHRAKQEFLDEKFFSNFNAQYLFMYVLLLHQKYVLYMLLTQIGIGEYNNLAQLESYRRELYEFETNFVFSRITEVAQYQEIYERMQDAFSLQSMYRDVKEPLLSLSDIREQQETENRRKSDKSLNMAIIMLSFLSFFSAIADGISIPKLFSGFFDTTVITIAQGVIFGIIVALLIVVIKNMLASRNKKVQ